MRLGGESASLLMDTNLTALAWGNRNIRAKGVYTIKLINSLQRSMIVYQLIETGLKKLQA